MTIDLRYGDTIEQMKLIPDKSIDFICCDLPFGTTQNKWDIVIPFNQLWEQYKRIIKDKGTVILFGNQPFTTDLICSNRSWFKYEIIWDKGRASGHLNAKIMPLRKHDNLIVFCNGKTTYNPQFTEGESYTRTNKSETCRGNYGKHKDSTIENDGYRYPTSILYYPIGRQQNKIHPTEKPIGLIEILIKQYSNEGETILDNTFGSCTTGIACINTNRNFIGIENNMDYFNISLKRVEEKRKEKVFNVVTSFGDGM
jgi:site-specific DNA-methyltransferase (adenine-specific)